jgi:hypothetical protein
LRALAEFIMRGRAQACAVGLLGNLFPFVSPATIGLVTLRKGSVEGLLVALWAVLPLIVLIYISDSSPLLTAVSVASLFMMVVAANVLTWSVSWSWTMLSSVVAGGLIASGLGFVLSDDVELLVAEIGEIIAKMDAEPSSEREVLVPGRQFMLGLIAWVLALSSIVSLLLSRWWQALLFNPGGFQEEFHSLRLSNQLAVAVLIAVVAGFYLPTEYRPWAQLAAIPLLLSGVALIHHVVKTLQLGSQWLMLMYFGLFVFSPTTGALLVGLAFSDSMLNLRSRLAAIRNR